ncbi:MAG: hypothetical protein HYV77_02245 [Candidatus Wildermuthbacteria bacterium]|nr:hypothetical protein [Candidatus Wildermuthbacteria bacterium]
MDKKYLKIVAAIVVVGLIAGGAFLLLSSKENQVSPNQNTIKSPTPSPTASPVPTAPSQSAVTISGLVVGNNTQAGNGWMRVDTGEGGVNVYYDKGAGCINTTPIALARTLKEGDKVEVYGKVSSEGLGTCDSAAYYIKKLAYSPGK